MSETAVTSNPQHLRLLEAILFASKDPIGEKSLTERLPEGVDIGALLEELRGQYAERGINFSPPVKP